jgi:hypothetical protein
LIASPIDSAIGSLVAVPDGTPPANGPIWFPLVPWLTIVVDTGPRGSVWV